MNYLLLVLITISLSIFVGCEKKPKIYNNFKVSNIVEIQHSQVVDRFNHFDAQRYHNILPKESKAFYLSKKLNSDVFLDFMAVDRVVYVYFVQSQRLDKAKALKFLNNPNMIVNTTVKNHIVSCYLKEGISFTDYTNFLINKYNLHEIYEKLSD